MIYTSYFAKIDKLPDTIIPISICGKAPYWYGGLQYKKLAPKWHFFKAYKDKQIDAQEYEKFYFKEVLCFLKPSKVIEELYELSKGKDVAMICYEKPLDFCHRHLAAKYLMEEMKVEEFSFSKT